MSRELSVASEHKSRKQRDYSFVDILERVGDGVHVDIIAREPKRRPSGKMKKWESGTDESSPSMPPGPESPKRTPSKR
jgi:hypothetical protein